MSGADFKALCERLNVDMLAARRVPGGSGHWEIVAMTCAGRTLVTRAPEMLDAMAQVLNRAEGSLS